MLYLLHPEQYGIASLATSLLAAVTLLAPFTLSDVLLSRPSDVDRLMGTATRLARLGQPMLVVFSNGLRIVLAGAGDHFRVEMVDFLELVAERLADPDGFAAESDTDAADCVVLVTGIAAHAGRGRDPGGHSAILRP
jgi:hypothetical protein